MYFCVLQFIKIYLCDWTSNSVQLFTLFLCLLTQWDSLKTAEYMFILVVLVSFIPVIMHPYKFPQLVGAFGKQLWRETIYPCCQSVCIEHCNCFKMDFCEILNLGFLLKFDMFQFSLKLENIADNLHVYLTHSNTNFLRKSYFKIDL